MEEKETEILEVQKGSPTPDLWGRRCSRRHGGHEQVKTADRAENEAGLKDCPDDAKLDESSSQHAGKFAC